MVDRGMSTLTSSAPAARAEGVAKRLRATMALVGVADTVVVTGRNLRHFVRQPQVLIFSTTSLAAAAAWIGGVLASSYRCAYGATGG